MQFHISKFTIESYEGVYNLWEQCEGVGLSGADSKENINIFLQRNPGMSYLAEVDNKIVGAVLAGHDGRRGYIHHLAVSVKYRQLGIGRALVERCLQVLREEEIQKCHIFIFNNNSSGVKFWESIGWSFRNDIGVISKFID